MTNPEEAVEAAARNLLLMAFGVASIFWAIRARWSK